MKEIWKWSIPIPEVLNDTVTITLPEGLNILSIQAQNTDLVLWGITDTSAPRHLTHRTFYICGTGFPLEYKGKHLATVQFKKGPQVLHIFDLGEQT